MRCMWAAGHRRHGAYRAYRASVWRVCSPWHAPCMHSNLYTKLRTTVNSSLPITVSQWLGRYAAGASPADLLPAALKRCEAMPAGTWIQVASRACLEAELDRLNELSVGCGDPAALLRRFPLYGVPFAVKDNIDVAGVPSTAACVLRTRPADSDATVVARLRDAGAICMGKTNLDQFATGLVGTRSPFGRPSSVYSAAHISGGSSSGSAVCVASGGVAFALGTDTAGSGRIPAAFNQIVGLKPTPGRVSTAGVMPACRSIDCISIFAHTVDEAALVLCAAEGLDERDPYSADVAGPGRWARSSLRVGVPSSPTFMTAAGYAAAWDSALAQLRSLGHVIVPIDFEPLDQVAALLYEGPWIAERHAAIEEILDHSPDALDPAVRAIVGRARALRGVDVFRGQYELQRLARTAQAVWSQVDVFAVPTAPGHPTFAEVDADPLGTNAALGRYTNFVNLLGWCALALPAGSTSAGLPFGITLIADHGHDVALMRAGRGWQDHIRLPSGCTGVVATNTAGDDMPQPRVVPVTRVAVVGAHLSGLPLNGQLTERGGWLVERTRTAPAYRLHALAGTVPLKPGLVRTPGQGHAIDVEVWELPLSGYGSFVAGIPHPLGVGQIELADGRWVQGFVCEAAAIQDAPDISRFGGWRAYLASLQATAQDLR